MGDDGRIQGRTGSPKDVVGSSYSSALFQPFPTLDTLSAVSLGGQLREEKIVPNTLMDTFQVAVGSVLLEHILQGAGNPLIPPVPILSSYLADEHFNFCTHTWTSSMFPVTRYSLRSRSPSSMVPVTLACSFFQGMRNLHDR